MIANVGVSINKQRPMLLLLGSLVGDEIWRSYTCQCESGSFAFCFCTAVLGTYCPAS